MNTPPLILLPYDEGTEEGGSILNDWVASNKIATPTKVPSVLKSLQNVALHAGAEMKKIKSL